MKLTYGPGILSAWVWRVKDAQVFFPANCSRNSRSEDSKGERAGSITATPRGDQMQDQRQWQEDAAAVETAKVHPCSLETVLARRGSRAPRSPGFGTRRQAGALASAQVTLRELQLWVPQGASCRVTGVQHGDLGAKGVGGTETSLLPPHGDLTPSPESSLCSGPWLGSSRKRFRSTNPGTE